MPASASRWRTSMRSHARTWMAENDGARDPDSAKFFGALRTIPEESETAGLVQSDLRQRLPETRRRIRRLGEFTSDSRRVRGKRRARFGGTAVALDSHHSFR